jgi:hypothetical protein
MLAAATVLFVCGFVPGTASAAPPANDDCSGAIVIPDGTFPLVVPPVNALDATPQGVDDGGLIPAACNASGTDYTVWYSFTPSVTALYTFTTCPAAGASGYVLDPVIAVLQSSDDTCDGTMTSLACNDSSICASPGDHARVQVVLTAGATYYMIVGHWVPDGAIPFSDAHYLIRIDRAESNDACAGAIPIPLNRVVSGLTIGANDDFQTPATSACFSGLPGTQNPTTSPGRDIVFTFTAPAAGSYSIRQVTSDPNAALRSQNPVLYASASCPAGGGEVACLAGANRATSLLATPTGINHNQSEELSCLPMTAGQTIYVFFDDGTFENAGGPLGREATACVCEVEPNGSTATATALSACPVDGSSASGATAHCTVGANAGSACLANTDCPGGTCFFDSVCVGGPNPGAACIPRCIGGFTPGAACATNANCGSGGTCQTNGACGVCTAGLNTGQNCATNAHCGLAGICNPGICARTGNEGDVDFWSLGTPATGSKVFAAIMAPAANDYDWRMRVTSTTETLGFDDDDGQSRQGTLASTIAGAVTTGTETFVRISRTGGRASEPYRLYAVVEPPITGAQPEIGDGLNIGNGWPELGLSAGFIDNGSEGGYVTGSFSSTSDSDCWQFFAHEGDEMVWFGDSNPNRIAGVGLNSNPQVVIYDAAGAGISNFIFPTGASRNTGPFTGNAGLEATTPQTTSFFQHWRARYTGMLALCFYPFPAINPPFPKAYAGSLSLNGGPIAAAGPGTTEADVQVTVSGPPGPVPTSGEVVLTVTVTNLGSEIAQHVALSGVLPAELGFLDLVVDDGFNGNNTMCEAVPDPGASGSIACTTMSIAPGVAVVYTLTVQVGNCLASGIDVLNTVTVTSISTDPNATNDSASWSAVTLAGTSCNDGNACTFADTCIDGECIGAEMTCFDGDICTSDACDPLFGCQLLPTDCDDDNPCTEDSCDSEAGCTHVPIAGTCTDGDNCTTGDTCVAGVCQPTGDCSETLFNPFTAGPISTKTVAGTPNGSDPIETSIYNPNFGTVSIAEGPVTVTPPVGYQLLDYQVVIEAPVAAVNQPLEITFDVWLGNPPPNPIPNIVIFRNGVAVPQCAPHALPTADPDPCVNGAVLGFNNTVRFPVYTTHASTWTFGYVGCDDANACTVDSGVYPDCAHTQLTCFDGHRCTNDACDSQVGCVFPPNTVACNDANACTQGDLCQAGSCVGGSPVTCPAADECHDPGMCDPDTGTCSGGEKPDGTACNDGDLCTSTDICQAGICAGGTPIVCVPLDQCHDAGSCDPGTGSCSNPPKADGASCTDGSACTQTDICQDGACTGTAYSWSGFLQPINADGTSVFKLGSTIPVKFRLTGACAGNASLVADIYFYKVSNSEGPINEAASTSAADTGTVFRYSPSDDLYIFNLGTKGKTEGTWQLGVDLHDGVGIRSVAVGLRK